MTKEEAIEKIRQEIERLKKENDNIKCSSNKAYCQGYGDAFVDLLPFLDTLSEEPVQKFNTDKLQEIAKPATPHKKPTPKDRAKFMEELHEYAESKKPDKSLEEEIKNYFQGYWPGTETVEQRNTDLHFTPSAIIRLARHFAEWQKQQMLKDAKTL